MSFANTRQMRVRWRREGARNIPDSALIWSYLGICTAHAVVKRRSRSFIKSAYYIGDCGDNHPFHHEGQNCKIGALHGSVSWTDLNLNRKERISNMQVHKRRNLLTFSIVKRKRSFYLFTLLNLNLIHNLFVEGQMPLKFQLLEQQLAILDLHNKETMILQK